ncbi:MAG: hypothetical protein NXY57DRAFT_1043909 [Lentinula lateritia]|nr:MAG: hypothetical protein NXY57DRAFT_1043909 [Lentinula lateritia]
MYHIKNDDVPDDARGLKHAFEIHIHILWNSLSESVAPEAPSNINIANFMKCHKQVNEVLNQPKVSLSRKSLKSVVFLRTTCQLDPGTIWRPDVLGASPTSFYNLAISSLELGLQNGGYVYFEPNLEYIHNTAFLCQIYRNYVYSHLKKSILKELREKGRLASDAVKRVMYKRRKKIQASITKSRV